MELQEYLSRREISPFGLWFEKLDPQAAAKIAIALERLASGYHSNLKSIGGGISEFRINAGPGYRIYLAFDGTRLIILLGGGTKQRQQRDIQQAKDCWQDYKQRRMRRPLHGANT